MVKATLSGPQGEPGAGADGSLRAALEQEADRVSGADARTAQAIGARIGAALLRRMEAHATLDLATIARRILLAALIACLVGLIGSAMTPLPRSLFFFGAIYFGAGFLVSALVSVAVAGAGRVAQSGFSREADALAALVGRVTGDAHAHLAPLRESLERSGPSDFGRLLDAASQARLATVAALHFFKASPVIGVDGDGYRCHVLAELYRGAGRGAMRRGGEWFGVICSLAIGALAGAGGLYFSLVGPLAWAPQPEIVSQAIDMETASPGTVSFAILTLALILLPLLFGPVFAQMRAVADPRGALAREPARALANEAQLKALAAAVERPNDLIERLSGALAALVAHASSGHGGRFTRDAAPDPQSDTPSWRQAPQGPRFVPSPFPAAPSPFLVSEKSREGRAKDARAPAPKRSLFSLPKPPGL